MRAFRLSILLSLKLRFFYESVLFWYNVAHVWTSFSNFKDVPCNKLSNAFAEENKFINFI